MSRTGRGKAVVAGGVQDQPEIPEEAPRNVRSARVPERLGFVLEGTLRRYREAVDGQPEDRHVFALIREDYLRLPWRRKPGP